MSKLSYPEMCIDDVLVFGIELTLVCTVNYVLNLLCNNNISFSELRHAMRIMGLPEQFDLTMKCMMQNATQPLPDATGASLKSLR